jgi:hypothetical protein
MGVLQITLIDVGVSLLVATLGALVVKTGVGPLERLRSRRAERKLTRKEATESREVEVKENCPRSEETVFLRYQGEVEVPLTVKPLGVLDETTLTRESRVWERYRAEIEKLHDAALREHRLQERLSEIFVQKSEHLATESYPERYATKLLHGGKLPRHRQLLDLTGESRIVENTFKNQSSKAQERPSPQISEVYERPDVGGGWLQGSGNA